MSCQFDIGDSELDRDHGILARLLDELENVCSGPRLPERGCSACPRKLAHACQERLKGICGRMQTLLLEHFQREQELMDALPRDIAARAHCERHRQEHVKFSTRYNFAATRLDLTQPAAGAREIEALVFDWVRDHALKFDAELAAITPHANDDRPCRT